MPKYWGDPGLHWGDPGLFWGEPDPAPEPDPLGRLHPVDWEPIQPGWGQFTLMSDYQWGGATAEFEVRITKAPIIAQRSDHPDRPRERNHGGNF